MIVKMLCIKSHGSNGFIHSCNFMINEKYDFDRINENLYKYQGIYFGKIEMNECFIEMNELRIKKLNSI